MARTSSVGRTTSVDVLGGGAHLVSGSYDKSVRLWDVSSGEQVASFKGHTSCVMTVADAGDGIHILTGSNDGTVRTVAHGLNLAAKAQVRVCVFVCVSCVDATPLATPTSTPTRPHPTLHTRTRSLALDPPLG